MFSIFAPISLILHSKTLLIISGSPIKEYVDKFLARLEEEINCIDPEDPADNISNIKTWILKYYDDTDPERKGFLLGKDPESPLYEFLRTEYSEINEPFQEFYGYYAQM